MRSGTVQVLANLAMRRRHVHGRTVSAMMLWCFCENWRWNNGAAGFMGMSAKLGGVRMVVDRLPIEGHVQDGARDGGE